MACDYDGCLYKTSQEHKSADPTKCIFHAKVDKKGVSPEVFFDLLARHIANKLFEFKGYIFHLFFNFPTYLPVNKNIDREVSFVDCQFLGQSEQKIKYRENDTTIEKSIMLCSSFYDLIFKYGLFFKNCVFAEAVNFQHCKVQGDQFLILNSKFKGEVFLSNSDFKNCSFTINSEKGKTIFSDKVYLHDLKFNSEIKELRDNFTISNTKFKKGFNLSNSYIKCLRYNFNKVDIESDITFLNNIQIESPTIHFTNNFFDSAFTNFKGSKLSGRIISFENSTFNSTTFEDAEFNKTDDVSQSINSFKNTNFIGKDISFWKTTFNCGVTDFENALFNCKVDFKNTKFLDGANFKSVKFTSYIYERDKENKLILSNKESDSKEVNIEFLKTQFDGDLVDFSESEFSCNKIEFDGITANSEVFFINNRIYDNSVINFKSMYLAENKRFIFREPEFKTSNKENPVYPLICFENINFNPIKTTFESIFDTNTIKFKGKNGKEYRTPTFIILFRYCYLKDVYFIMTSSSNISFYKSFFDEAIFISAQWNYEIDKIFKLIPYERKNIIFEDYLLNGELAMGYDFKEMIEDRVAKSIHFNKYKIEDLNGNDEIASLYRRLKTSLDRTKDYIQAGWFYFNEYEMLRLYNKQRKGHFFKWKYFLYSVYKYLAGYGEKPFWAFLWLVFFTCLLSGLNFLNGFKYRGGEINYDIILNPEINYTYDNAIWFKDLIKAIFFTFSRVLPTSYIPIDKSDFGTLDSIGLSLGVISAFILIFFITMIFSGLKRHFRRF